MVMGLSRMKSLRRLLGTQSSQLSSSTSDKRSKLILENRRRSQPAKRNLAGLIQDEVSHTVSCIERLDCSDLSRFFHEW